MTKRDVAPAPSPALLWTLICLVVLIWAVNPAIGKIALREWGGLELVTLRTTLAAFFILPPLFLTRERRSIAPLDWPRLIVLGPVLQVGNQVLFVVGLEHTSVAHTAFIFSTSPVWILLLAAMRGQEQIRGKKLVGMAVSIAGIVLLSRQRGGAVEATLFGDLLTLCATLTFAAFTVYGKEMRVRYGSVTINAVAYIGGALAVQPLLWGVYGGLPPRGAPLDAWAALLYMAIFPAVIAYVIYYWALGYIPASRLAVVQYLQPPFAAGLGWLIVGETMTGGAVVAGAVILLGVYLAERPDRARARIA